MKYVISVLIFFAIGYCQFKVNLDKFTAIKAKKLSDGKASVQDLNDLKNYLYKNNGVPKKKFFQILNVLYSYLSQYSTSTLEDMVTIYEDLIGNQHIEILKGKAKNSRSYYHVFFDYSRALFFLDKKKYKRYSDFISKNVKKYELYAFYARLKIIEMENYIQNNEVEKLFKVGIENIAFVVKHKHHIKSVLSNNSYLHIFLRNIEYLGTIYKNMGDYKFSVFYYQFIHVENLVYYKKNYPNVYMKYVIDGYIKMAEVRMRQGLMSDAADLMYQAIDYSNIYDFNIYKPRLNANFSALFLQKGKLDSAKSYLDKTKQLLNDSKNIEIKDLLAESSFLWGEYQKKKGDYDAALQSYQDAYKQYSKLYGKHEFTSMALYKLGESYRLKGKIGEAFSYYQKALINIDKSIEENEKNYKVKNIYQSPPLKRYNSNRHVLDLLLSKAELYREERGKGLEGRKQLISFYNDARRVLNETEALFLEEDGKLDLLKSYSHIYDELITLHHEVYRKTGKKEELSAVFELIQEGKSRLLKYDLYKKLLSRGTGSNRLKELSDLENSLSIYQTDLYKYDFSGRENDEEHYNLLESYLTKLFEYLGEKREIRKEYENELTRLQSKKLDLASFQESLEKDELAISYYSGKEAVYGLGITKEKVSLEKLGSKNISNEIRDFISAIKFIEPVRTEDLSRTLYKSLLKPILDVFPEKRKLTINPDHELSLLPFDALKREGRYLIEDYEIAYELSFDLNEKLLEKTEEKSLIGFAPVFKKKAGKGETYRNLDEAFLKALLKEENLKESIKLSKEVTELKESRKELERISANFKKHKWKTEVYFEKDATESRFKNKDLSSYRIVHLSTHSYHNRKNANLSGILFSAEGNKEDGLLFSSEIRGLQFNADLVTLSSCESASGNIAKGEGALSLSRSFLMSGAKRTLVSLWKVDDRSTRKLMESFYENYLSGKSFKEALRETKLSLLKNENYSFPRYWAAFLLNSH